MHVHHHDVIQATYSHFQKHTTQAPTKGYKSAHVSQII